MKNLLFVGAVVALMAAPVYADWNTGFEAPGYTGSPAGTLLAGQDLWYNPVAGSSEYLAFTYAGNAYGFPANPGGGGDQFVAGRSAGGAAVARAQHPVDFSGPDEWTIDFDIAAKWMGIGASAPNLGSFSLQPSATNTYFQTLYNWQDATSPGLWDANYVTAEFPAPGTSPGPAWVGLQPDHWYSQSTTFRFSDRLILSVSITDLTTGVETTLDNPGGATPWHLIPGNGVLPTDVRFFAGGALGNTVAWDNLSIPEPATLALLALGALGLLRRR